MIRVIVYLSRDTWREHRPAMERIVDWDASLRFPFEETVKVMKCLYGEKAIVNVEVE